EIAERRRPTPPGDHAGRQSSRNILCYNMILLYRGMPDPVPLEGRRPPGHGPRRARSLLPISLVRWRLSHTQKRLAPHRAEASSYVPSWVAVDVRGCLRMPPETLL